MKQYFVYVLASETRTIYTGFTNDLERRHSEHRNGGSSRFSGKYKTLKLVHCEVFGEVLDAITREKQIKGWTRAKKIALIEERNPAWLDLASDRTQLDMCK